VNTPRATSLAAMSGFTRPAPTLFVSKDSKAFDQGQTATLIYGEDLQKISIEGRGLSMDRVNTNGASATWTTPTSGPISS
jgi:hypothetical protein